MYRKKITYQDRKKIEELLKENKPIREIAQIIGVHFTTIYKELHRGGDPYSASRAQESL